MARKIFDFDELKRRLGEGIKARSQLAHAEQYNPTWFELIWPRAEVRRLRERLRAMMEQESLAGGHALRLYWENCNLQKYKNHFEGLGKEFIPSEEHNRVLRQLDKTRKLLESSEKSKQLVMDKWQAYLDKA